MYKKFIGSNLLVILVLLFTASVFPQNTIEDISGEVLDANGAAIADASIVVNRAGFGELKRVQTGPDGRFLLSELEHGTYEFIVSAEGFSSLVRSVAIGADHPKKLEFTLAVGNISAEVTVTATRSQVATTDTTVTVSVVGRAELEERPVNTLGDIFRNLPGTSTVNEGSFQVRPRIRGLDSNRVLVLVDGERLNNGRTSTQQSGIEIGLVETNQVDTIEVVRGSGSVLYGTDALGGTINIITKGVQRNTDGGFKLGASFDGFYSSNDSGRRGSVGLTGSGSRFAFRIAQSLERYGNYFAADPEGRFIDGVAADGEVLNGQSHGSNTQVTGRVFFDDDNDLRINYGRRRVGNIGVPTLSGFFNAFFPFSDRDKVSARYETRNVTRHLAKVTGSFFYQEQRRNFSNILDIPAFPPFFPGIHQISETVTNTDTIGFDVQTNWLLGNDNMMTAGFSGFRDTNSDKRRIENTIPFTSVDNSKSVPDASFGSFAGFAQDQFELGKYLRIIGGLRVERFTSRSKPTVGFGLPTGLTPQQVEDLGLAGLENGLDVSQTAATGDVGAVVKVTDQISLTARLGRSFRVPNIFERFFTDFGSVEGFVVGNPALEPESGFNFDGSVKFRASKFAGSVTYFRNSYRNFLSNEIALDRDGAPIVILGGRSAIDVYQTINIDRARIQGVEADLEASLRLGFGFLTPSANFSYLRGDNLTENQPLNAITPFKGVLALRWENLRSNYYVDWLTRTAFKQDRLSQSFLAVNGGPEPGYTVSDLRGGYIHRAKRIRLSFNVGVTNLFGRFYQEQYVLAPARGRSFVFGTRWEWQ